MKNHQTKHPIGAHQTVSVNITTATGTQSLRIGFTDQRLTAYGGLAVWSGFLHQKRFRQQLQQALPHAPTSPNAYAPTDTALSLIGGILCGADKLSRAAHLASDAAVAQVLGVEAIPSQSTFSRFLAPFTQASAQALGTLHTWAAGRLPTPREEVLDLDSWALLHEDGHQEGVAVGYTKAGLKPCHRPLVAALASSKLVVNFWLRRGDSACANNAAAFLETTLAALPRHIRPWLVRADSGFCAPSVLEAVERRGLKFIVAARLTSKLQGLCRHQDGAWTDTEVRGVQVQEVGAARAGWRLIVIRQKIAERPEAGGKRLLELPGYRFQALLTNLPAHWSALAVWRRYHGRADVENRIKELGHQFGVRGLCCRKFWATEALCHLALVAYNLCVLLQRHLGLLEKVELGTLRWRLFGRAAVWSRAAGRSTLKLAVRGETARQWWLRLLERLTSSVPNCNAVDSLSD